MSYFKDERDYPFLKTLKDNYRIIRAEYVRYEEDELVKTRKHFTCNMTTAKRSVRSSFTHWKVLSFCTHFRTVRQIFEEQKIKLPPEMEEFLDYVEKNHFAQTRALLAQVRSAPENGLINAWFSYFEPGARLALHINDDPYMYRAHLGLIVPEGNIGFKVRDETTNWREGEILVFDSTNPHTAWNLTDSGRLVLIVDFFRPERNREEMAAMERVQFQRMMSHNPFSVGMSGGYVELDDETKQKYAIPWVESA